MIILEKLIDKIPYKKRIWITGFIKTTLSAALISTGVVSISAGIIDHPLVEHWNEVGIILGSLAIMMAIVIIVIIDKYDEKKKKDELKIIDKTIEEKAEEIALRLVNEKLKEIEKNCK